ncbi:MAG: hypothetical protein CMN76_10415 [Spirochaetaceae bacterium]|nr:hypothetical protein [Spirochaetaceae bacterium]|tara:strand:- start:50874 stop:51362 length:489 start_codon:yes stop_codon:yes gene_type:complete
MRSTRASFRIAGLLWALVFGSLALILVWQDQLEKDIAAKLESNGQSTFVHLNRLQRKRKSLIPDMDLALFKQPGVSYFYTYSYLYNGRNYTVTEEVSVDLYYLHREGENLEAIRYVDDRNYPHTRLKGNPHQKQNHLLLLLTSAIACFGLALTLLGLLPSRS